MAIIDIRIRSLRQLFDSLDPSPFHERGLDVDAETYLVDSASDLPAAPLSLVIHAPEAMRARMDEAAKAIHGHFRYRHEQSLRRHRRRMRASRVALFAGLLIMVACLGLRALLMQWIGNGIAQGIGEGLLVLGWVALWRPAEMLLFERWESAQERLILARLACAKVEFALLPKDGA